MSPRQVLQTVRRKEIGVLAVSYVTRAWFCFDSRFVLLTLSFTDSAGPSKVKTGKPEEANPDHREKKSDLASRDTGGSY